MLFSYKWLQELIDGKLPSPEKLADVLALHAFEIEEVRELEKDTVLDVDITANRVSDCASHVGIARECAAILNLKLKTPKIEIDVEESKEYEIKIEAKDGCSRYTACVVKDVQVGESPKWLKSRLEVCGLQPINNVVDAMNYVMLETGQPLHAFDLDKLDGGLKVRFGKKEERVVTLDKQDVELDGSILVIADNSRALAVAGIKGGEGPEVDRDTKNILIEAANFDPVMIRKASQKIKIRTDASHRFEHGLDSNLTKESALRAAQLVADLCSVTDKAVLSDVYLDKIEPVNVKLRKSRMDSLLGVEISLDDASGILGRLGFEMVDGKEDHLLVRVPTRRVDVSIEEDLIEEVGRIYGYVNIPSELPSSIISMPQKNINVFWEEFVKDSLKESGMTEVYNYSFVSEDKAERFHFDDDLLMEVANPLSKHYTHMTPSLICNMVSAVRTNLKNYSSFKIFELGPVFKVKKGKISERKRLVGAIVSQDGFLEAKGIVDDLLASMKITDVLWDNSDPEPGESSKKIWNLPMSVEIKSRRERIGFMGPLSKIVLLKERIKDDVIVFDLDFEKLLELASQEHEYEVISPYPVATRDVAVLVSSEDKVVDVLNAINEVGGELVRDVDLFDIYEGEELGEGRKNLAFHIMYQAQDRTLEKKELDELQERIITRLEKEGWEVRR